MMRNGEIQPKPTESKAVQNIFQAYLNGSSRACHMQIEMKAKYPIVTEEARTQKELVNTYALLDTITEQMTADDIYVSGSSGTCIDVSMQTFRVKKGQRVFCTKGLASMGFGVPATIGACLAGDRRRTVCVNGDGGFQMNIQELETIHRLNLPIKIFVLNNQGYAQIHATQKNIFQGHYVACDADSHLTLSPISAVAGAYGLKTVQIHSNEELQERVKKTLDPESPWGLLGCYDGTAHCLL